jgi:hypothetical protein
MKVTSIIFSAVAMLAATVAAAPSNAITDINELVYNELTKRYCCPLSVCVRGGCNNVSLHHDCDHSKF